MFYVYIALHMVDTSMLLSLYTIYGIKLLKIKLAVFVIKINNFKLHEGVRQAVLELLGTNVA